MQAALVLLDCWMPDSFVPQTVHHSLLWGVLRKRLAVSFGPGLSQLFSLVCQFVWVFERKKTNSLGARSSPITLYSSTVTLTVPELLMRTHLWMRAFPRNSACPQSPAQQCSKSFVSTPRLRRLQTHSLLLAKAVWGL